jgi:hypothetical protein
VQIVIDLSPGGALRITIDGADVVAAAPRPGAPIDLCSCPPTPPPAGGARAATAREILDAIGPDMLTAEELAERMGRDCNSHFRGRLTELFKLGHLVKGCAGGFAVRQPR